MFQSRILERLNRMLDAGIDGTFQESDYNESKLSRLESKWKHYLGQSRQSKESLDLERERIKGLVSDISHQTKTPMTNIRMYSELLFERLNQKQDAEGMRVAGELMRQTEKLDFLIGCLVKISRLESSIVEVEPKEQDVSAMAAEAADAMRPKAERKNIRIVYSGVKADACFDRKWTKEALENIIDNAIKYSPEGSKIHIFVKTYEMYVQIAVCDQGIGVSEEEIPKIFGRFYRGRGVRDEEGVGIGLFLAREILKRENGYIKVQSAAGKGSAFSVYLKRE